MDFSFKSLQKQKKMNSQIFDIAVIGSGPSGVAAIGVLLAQKIQKIIWIDPQFNGGRMPLYTKVPSNTKVRIFRDFVQKCETFKKFGDLEGLNENPLTPYKGLDGEKGCSLDLCLKNLNILTNNIRKFYPSNVIFSKGYVNSLIQERNKDSYKWLIKVQNENTLEEVQSKAVILATGSKPRYFPESNDFSRRFGVKTGNNTYLPESIDLDTCLDPSLLQKQVKTDDVVAVIGSSHSSMVVIKNLVELNESPKKIICLYIEPLKYAEYMPEGWILYDNTGLKGDVAEWVKNYLIKGKIPQVEMNLIDKQQTVLKEKIPLCTKIIYTIGFERNQVPQIVLNVGLTNETIDDKKISYNNKTSEILVIDGHNKKTLDGLYGCGIAWPEQTIDPRGNVEYAVGLAKFMNYANRFIPEVVLRNLRLQVLGKGKL